eukprot:COSAG02_NODE_1829_length_10738_cov_4.595827_2_plen_99_part_00
MEVSIISDTADVFEVSLDGTVRGHCHFSAAAFCLYHRAHVTANACGRTSLLAVMLTLWFAKCYAQLIHSKGTMGHGKCGTAQEIQRIIDQTQALIDSR